MYFIPGCKGLSMGGACQWEQRDCCSAAEMDYDPVPGMGQRHAGDGVLPEPVESGTGSVDWVATGEKKLSQLKLLCEERSKKVAELERKKERLLREQRRLALRLMRSIAALEDTWPQDQGP